MDYSDKYAKFLHWWEVASWSVLVDRNFTAHEMAELTNFDTQVSEFLERLSRAYSDKVKGAAVYNCRLSDQVHVS